MKVEIKELLTILRDDYKIDISKDIENEIIEKNKNKYNVNDKVYWKAQVSYDRGESKFLQGIISKNEYNKILKVKKKNENYEVNFGEITEYVEMYCNLKDIEFSDDADDIIFFYECKFDNNELMDFLENIL